MSDDSEIKDFDTSKTAVTEMKTLWGCLQLLIILSVTHQTTSTW